MPIPNVQSNSSASSQAVCPASDTRPSEKKGIQAPKPSESLTAGRRFLQVLGRFNGDASARFEEASPDQKAKAPLGLYDELNFF